jgi:hypothetical protein
LVFFLLYLITRHMAEKNEILINLHYTILPTVDVSLPLIFSM